MTANNKRLKQLTLVINGVDYACQATDVNVVNNTPDGDKVFTFCADGEFREETDDDWALEVKWVSDWTAGGFNRILEANNGVTVPAIVTFHTDALGTWSHRETGNVILKAPSKGGTVRTTDMSEQTFLFVGKPVTTYP